MLSRERSNSRRPARHERGSSSRATGWRAGRETEERRNKVSKSHTFLLQGWAGGQSQNTPVGGPLIKVQRVQGGPGGGGGRGGPGGGQREEAVRLGLLPGRDPEAGAVADRDKVKRAGSCACRARTGGSVQCLPASSVSRQNVAAMRYKIGWLGGAGGPWTPRCCGCRATPSRAWVEAINGCRLDSASLRAGHSVVAWIFYKPPINRTKTGRREMYVVVCGRRRVSGMQVRAGGWLSVREKNQGNMGAASSSVVSLEGVGLPSRGARRFLLLGGAVSIFIDRGLLS